MIRATRIFIGILVTLTFALHTQSAAEQGKSKTKSFSVGKGGSLQVFISEGDILISAWDKNEVLVKAIGIGDDETDGLTISQSGSTVRVKSHASPESSDLRFDISVPSRFDIDIQTSSGDIDVQGSLVGNLKGSTSAGTIRLGNLGGTVSMSTSGGDIETGSIQGDLELRTSGGDIRMGSVSGEADVSTAGGEITIDNVGKRLRAKTAGGNISIGNVGGDAVVSTAGGNIVVGKVSGSASLTTAGGDIDLRSATGAVKATTAGGDLRFENISGSVDGTTAGGDVHVQLVPGINGRSRLTSASGDVHLYIPEKARATVNARIHIKGWWRSLSKEFDIHSDFKLENYEKDEHSREIRGTINLNGGGEVIFLETMMGNIEIRKAKQQ